MLYYKMKLYKYDDICREPRILSLSLGHNKTIVLGRISILSISSPSMSLLKPLQSCLYSTTIKKLLRSTKTFLNLNTMIFSLILPGFHAALDTLEWLPLETSFSSVSWLISSLVSYLLLCPQNLWPLFFSCHIWIFTNMQGQGLSLLSHNLYLNFHLIQLVFSKWMP